MGELTVRRERHIVGPRYQAAEKAERTAGAGRAAEKTAAVPKPLGELMLRLRRAEGELRQSQRTLQAGEAVLAEVQERLGRLAELAEQGGSDRAALQEELERLRQEIDRMVDGAFAGDTRLFLDGEPETEYGAERPQDLGEKGAEGMRALPGWLLKGMAGLSPERLLDMLGLDKNSRGGELLAALLGTPLEESSSAACLAALYLGGIISGGTASKAVSLGESLEGLRMLLEKIGEGYSPDEAVMLLTNGTFASLPDFQQQLTSGIAPGITDTLLDLLLSMGEEVPAGVSLAALLAGMEGADLELMGALLAAAEEGGFASEEAGSQLEAPPFSTLELGNIQVLGRDLAGVSAAEGGGELIVGGDQAVVLQGSAGEKQALTLTGSGPVTLRDIQLPVLTVRSPAAQVLSAGETVLEEVRLLPGTSLTLGGGGLVRLGSCQGGADSVLRLTGGAVTVSAEDGEAMGRLDVPMVIDGPVFLAARAARVVDAAGKPLTPFDIVWKTFLPGWSAVTALSVNGHQGRALLLGGESARLWLGREDPFRDSPVHAVVIWGRDKENRARTRYAYLHWNQEAGAFEETVMYPNPFNVTGGEPGTDWVYEEESHTLRILTAQVTAVSGGAGVDANQKPFSGRLALEDGIGALGLTLGGVACRVSEGGAFRLGRENDVTLLLRSGTENHFESGAGCAGVSVGERTSLRVDCPEARENSRNPAGTLSASGGAGGAGIGRDSGAGKDQTGRIVIRGGVITAVGTGGGAGIGAGKRGAMGSLEILGGPVSATGAAGGGAGIGGALGASIGNISIQGGRITALAMGHAAAIGAGVRGTCGDILIDGTARIEKALGGDPGADIGACLFGSCGKVRISGGADIGRARLWTRSGVPLQMGAETVTLPQFRLSSRALGLDRASLATQEAAQAARAIIERDRRWVAQIQDAYQVLYQRLERSVGGILGAQRCLNGAEGPVRDTQAAGALLEDMRRSIPLSSSQAMRTHGKRGTEDVRRLFR